MKTSILERLVSSHFQRFFPHQTASDQFNLTLKSGRVVTIGLKDSADLQVVVKNEWWHLEYLCCKVKAHAPANCLTVAEDCADFWYRETCFTAGSFNIQIVTTRSGERAVISRRSDSPPKVELKKYPSEFTASEWSALLDGQVLHPEGEHWGHAPGSYLLALAAEKLLIRVADRCQEGPLFDWQLLAFAALDKRGLVQSLLPVFADYAAYLASPEWKQIRSEVWTRDQGKCVFCLRAGYSVHHVVYPKVIGTEEPTTLLTVCQRCHETLHGALAAASRTEQGTHLPRIVGQVLT